MAGPAAAMMTVVEILLPYTQPFDWQGLLAFFRGRAIDGIEEVGPDHYRRTVALDEGAGLLELRNDPAAGLLVAAVHAAMPVEPAPVADRLRRHLDLDADLPVIARHLARDRVLAPLVARRPAVRIPGFWDPFETAIRAVLGQQVSLGAARVLAARLTARAGRTMTTPTGRRPDRLFPMPADLLAADLSAMGMPGARVRTLQAMSEAALVDPDLFTRSPTLAETVQRLRAIKGVGDWTAQYIALRACREPDAFPAGDVGLLRGMTAAGQRPTAAALAARSEAWRPFRAYAAHHIWAADADGSASSSERGTGAQ